MKTLIYQYWDGDDTSGNKSGREEMKKYSDSIGCEYLY